MGAHRVGPVDCDCGRAAWPVRHHSWTRARFVYQRAPHWRPKLKIMLAHNSRLPGTPAAISVYTDPAPRGRRQPPPGLIQMGGRHKTKNRPLRRGRSPFRLPRSPDPRGIVCVRTCRRRRPACEEQAGLWQARDHVRRIRRHLIRGRGRIREESCLPLSPRTTLMAKANRRFAPGMPPSVRE